MCRYLNIDTNWNALILVIIKISYSAMIPLSIIHCRGPPYSKPFLRNYYINFFSDYEIFWYNFDAIIDAAFLHFVLHYFFPNMNLKLRRFLCIVVINEKLQCDPKIMYTHFCNIFLYVEVDLEY